MLSGLTLNCVDLHFSDLVLAEHISFGDAEEQRVGDLTSSARHQHTDRFGLRRRGGKKQQLTTKTQQPAHLDLRNYGLCNS